MRGYFDFEKEALSLIYSYLKNKKQSPRINNVYNTFLELISGVPLESVVGALLFKYFSKQQKRRFIITPVIILYQRNHLTLTH